MSMECEKKKAPIGVFDSGVGGLTVVREITRQLPHENIVYFGDTARVPYGSKSKSNIIRFSEKIIRFLKTKQVKAIVIACNTASALALDAVRDEFDIPIIGVIVPGARAAVEATANGEIGVVGTDATVKSGTYTKVIHQMDPNIHVREKACPLFVPLVEEGFKEHVVTEEVIEYYLESLKHTEIDAPAFATSFAASATPPPITTAVTLSASFLAGDNISNPTLTGFPSAVSTYTMIFLHSAMSFVLPS